MHNTAPLHNMWVWLITDWGGESRERGIGISVVTSIALEPPRANAKKQEAEKWMSRWKDEWTDELINGWINGYLFIYSSWIQTDRLMNG